MNKQMSLSALSEELTQVRIKEKEFLKQIERMVPWGEWSVIIKLYDYKRARENKPYEPELVAALTATKSL